MSSTTIGPRSAWRESSSSSAGVEPTHRSSGVMASQRCAAGCPSRSARSRCAHVWVSALYQRSPWRRASRVAIVVLPEPGGPPIQRTYVNVCTRRAESLRYQVRQDRREMKSPWPAADRQVTPVTRELQVNAARRHVCPYGSRT